MSCVIEMEVLVLGAGSERRQVGITANSEYYFGFNLQSSSRPPAAYTHSERMQELKGADLQTQKASQRTERASLTLSE